MNKEKLMIEKNLKEDYVNARKNEFIYRPPGGEPVCHQSTLGVKFSNEVRFLDPWGFMLIGRTRWQRFLFKLRHPIAYSHRWLFRTYYRVRRLFINDRSLNTKIAKGKHDFPISNKSTEHPDKDLLEKITYGYDNVYFGE